MPAVNLLAALAVGLLGCHGVRVHLGGLLQRVLGGIQYEDIHVRRRLHALPRDRDIVLADAEEAAARQDEIADPAARGIDDHIFHAAEIFIARAPHVGTGDVVGTEGLVHLCHRLGRGQLLLAVAAHPAAVSTGPAQLLAVFAIGVAQFGKDRAAALFLTTPRFETGDARYAWMNTSLFVSEGRIMEGIGVEYRVHRVA